jgi:hypothetical protein
MVRVCTLMGKTTNSYRMLVENTELRQYLGDLGVDGRIILKLIIKKRI